MSSIAVVGSMTTGHDACPPVPVIEGIGWITIDGIPVTAVGCKCQGHSCEDHGYHAPIISDGAPFILAEGIRLARVGDPVQWGGCPSPHRIATGIDWISISD